MPQKANIPTRPSVIGQWLEPGGAAAAEGIQRFLAGIGIVVRNGNLPADTLLPNMDVVAGEIVVDPDRSGWPGDLLHEAGHIAVTDSAKRGAAAVTPDPAEEMAAIAWSVIAAAACEIPLGTLFHPQGYKGGSQSLIEAFECGQGFGTPMLQYWGMCDAVPSDQRDGALPTLSRWLR